MLSAENEKGQFITLVNKSKKAIDYLRLNESFNCPACKSKVIIKAGTMMIPHFAHQNKTNCNTGHGGEGSYHYQGKLLLYEWLKNQQLDVRLEHYLPEIKQRPDLLLNINNKYIAIEYQCVKIDPRMIFQRNRGYKKINIIPIWIIGANLYKRHSPYHIQTNQFTHSLIHRFSDKHPTSIFYFCPHQKQLSLVQDIIPTSTNQVIAKQTFLRLKDASFLHLFLKRFFTNHELYSLWKNELKAFRLRKRSNYGKERLWRNWLYERGLHIDYIPTHIYLPVRSQYRMRIPLWQWQSRFELEFLRHKPVHKVFTLEEATKVIQSYERHTIDQQLIHVKDNPMKEYLQLLCQIGLLEQINQQQFMRLQPLTYYQHIEEAIVGDNEVLNQFMYN